MRLIHKLEPIFWMLFGAGGFVVAFTLPALILGVLILAPMGAGRPGLTYDRAHLLASSLPGKGFLLVVIVLALWHAAHHLRHFILDLFGHSGMVAGAYLSYGLALAGTVAALAVVGGL